MGARSEVLRFIRYGIWHFTSLEGARKIHHDGVIRPSQRSGRFGDCYAAHRGAVALFDMSSDLREIEGQYIEMQESNILGFLGRFDEAAVGIKLHEEIGIALLGPVGVDGFHVPSVEEEDRAYRPNCIPYFERWHLGPIALTGVEQVDVWKIAKQQINVLQSSEDWQRVGTYQSFSEALRGC